ncbi:hypothetical protein K2Z83_19725 [Oscillochloris sp. ZM17-4]|uniref:hypothetical protein n=1 Tax=Oscillochloris sp. ZM17-4 TaxID=2866714 RepID=UPI001C73D0BE|nr:hypothetical protein [Oscillochloris sp. ZM17-4]MBX0329898.1 hypothetical protein [Oscillochloris sp. ZM17-4]
MDDDEFFMDPDGVRNIAKILDGVADFFTVVVKTLDGMLAILKGTAFIGRVGGAVWIAFIELIKPFIEEHLVEKINELSSDVSRAVDMHEGKDVEGSRFFTPSS